MPNELQLVILFSLSKRMTVYFRASVYTGFHRVDTFKTTSTLARNVAAAAKQL